MGFHQFIHILFTHKLKETTSTLKVKVGYVFIEINEGFIRAHFQQCASDSPNSC